MARKCIPIEPLYISIYLLNEKRSLFYKICIMKAWIRMKLAKYLTWASSTCTALRRTLGVLRICLADPVGQVEIIMLLLCQGRHEAVVALSDLRRFREESSLPLHASCTSLEITEKWDECFWWAIWRELHSCVLWPFVSWPAHEMCCGMRAVFGMGWLYLSSGLCGWAASGSQAWFADVLTQCCL